MFEIPVLPVHGGFDLTVISRGFWEVGMIVVCSLKDLKRESKSQGYTGSCPAQCLTAGSFRTESYGRANLEGTLNCGNVWVGSPPPTTCRVPRISFKVFLQLLWTDVKISFGLELLPNVYILSLWSIFLPTLHTEGRYWGIWWTGLVIGFWGVLALLPLHFLAMAH